ncbi:MAG: TIGR03986 family type III CRISPR-associated RAMP protein [Thermodesulfovibrionales bacterium]
MSWDIKQNPYNFVRFSERIVEKDEKGSPLPPPDHSVFSSKSGYIECELRNETPLFTRGKEIGSQEYSFLKINNKLAILSTSIKGMIRSFIEALTGSCLSNFDGGRLDFRKPTNWAGQATYVGIITKIPKTGGELGEIKELEVAWVQTYQNDIKRGSNPQLPKIDLTGFKNGQRVYVKVAEPVTPYINSKGKKIPISYHYVTHIRDAEGSPVSGEKIGYLKLTGKTIPNKKRERVFFENSLGTINFDFREKEDYDYILDTQLARKEKGHSFNTNYQHRKLSVGDLVYFQKEGGKAVKLSNVAVPRLRYIKGRGDRLGRPDDYRRCSKSHPCLACGLFGFVDGEECWAGRVSFSHAIINIHEPVTLQKIKLRPLGSPNPTSCNLYLITMDKNGKPTNIVRDYDGYQIIDNRGNKRDNQDINAPVVLCGRKFYWHKKEIDKILEEAQKISPEIKSQKVISNIEVLTSSNTFKFRVYFHNLTDFELGLLLYALKLEGNMRHKLGMAKNLGFGTVKIDIKVLYIDNLEKKYTTVNTDYRDDKTGEVDKLIERFKSKIPNFDNLPAVQDLKRILDPSKAPSNIGYPEEPDGRNYRWYMEHKNTPLPLLLDQ